MRPTGGDSSYYDLPRGPHGEWPKTIHEVILWWNNGQGMSWPQANVVKAMMRLGLKPAGKAGEIYNWEKSKWFSDDSLMRLYEEIKPHGRTDAEKD
jgi:hypothetical protein